MPGLFPSSYQDIGFPMLSITSEVTLLTRSCLKLTSGDPKYYNFQVQINNQTSISTLKRETGKTVATALVPTDGSWNPKKIRDELLSNMKL
jgi:hypothetical protein